MALRIGRALLPVLALAIFVATLKACFQAARAAGHLDVWDEMGWTPVISALGEKEPERTFFRGGFSALAAVLALTLVARALQLRGDGALAGAWVRRGFVVFSGAIAIVALLVMAWIPDDVSPLHFFAALLTFFFLSTWELLESTLVLTAVRARGVRWFHVLQLLWSFACPFASCAFVGKWIASGDAEPQYVAVGLQFAWFLGAIPELVRAPLPSPVRA